MPSDIKLTSGQGDMKARLDKRLRNSGQGDGTTPNLTVKHGDGSRRTFHNLHHGSTQHGTSNDRGKPTEGKK
jgi:hypothetical protein